MQSPTWKNPIINFIDENCIVFEDTEENSLEYTNVHNRFKKLIDGQLEAFIQDLGIQPPDFVKACSLAKNKIHENLVMQLLSVDDFLLFKKMMTHRNVTMNMQAVEQMRKKGRKVDGIQKKVAKHAVSQVQGKVDDEEAAIAQALAESKALYVSRNHHHR